MSEETDTSPGANPTTANVGTKGLWGHVQEQCIAYLVALIGTLAAIIGGIWIDDIKDDINTSLCALHRVNMRQDLAALYSMAIETPTEYIDLSHPAIGRSQSVSEEAKSLKSLCPDLEQLGVDAAALARSLSQYARGDYSALVRDAKSGGRLSFVHHNLVASSYNRLSVEVPQELGVRYRTLAKQHMDRAISSFQTEYSGLEPHRVLKKMECNSLTVSNNANNDDRIECMQTLLMMDENPTVVLNLSMLLAGRAIETGSTEDKVEALTLFSQFSDNAPYSICRHDVLKNAALRTFTSDEESSALINKALSRLRC